MRCCHIYVANICNLLFSLITKKKKYTIYYDIWREPWAEPLSSIDNVIINKLVPEQNDVLKI